MIRLRRILVWGLLAAIIGGTIYISMRPRPVLVDVAVVKFAPMDVRVEEDGQTRIRERYLVSSPLAGRLMRITLDVGDAVKSEDTVLARMEPTDPTLLDPREVAMANARVKQAEQRLEVARADLARAEAALNFAEVEMGRVRQMREANAASDSEFAAQELRFLQAVEETRAAAHAVDIAEYELELQRAALVFTDKDAERDEDMMLLIRAPIDGRVLRIHQESSAVVTPGTELLEVGDPSDLEVVADVLSRDAVRIHAGDPVIFERWGGEQPLEGRVRLVEPSGFTKLSALGVEEQRVNVVMDFVDPPEARRQLGDGFRVDCQIIVWQSERTLQVPTSALFRVDGEWSLFVVEGGLARLTPVHIGHNNGQVAEVVSGLSAGTSVITHPSDSVDEGVAVATR